MLGITRGTKRLIIISIFLLLLIALGVAIYFIKRPAPTCFDQKQNQNETGVDCGGICTLACIEVLTGEDLQVKEVAIIPDAAGKYDVLGEVTNPNGEVGASDFHYAFILKGSSGEELGRQEGNDWILPRETKTLLAFNFSPTSTPTTATLELSNYKWERLMGYQEKPNLTINNKRYNQISGGVGFGEVFGTLTNESPYDFRSVIVRIILRDDQNKPLAVQQTVFNTVTTGQQREINLSWPTAFAGAVTRVDMEVDADVYHSDNFLKQYFPGGRFQEVGNPGNF